jgi:GT2 family glycosyltransferase
MLETIPLRDRLTDRRPAPVSDSRVDAAAPTSLVDVSVCIANWNCRDMLRDCLQSLQSQGQGVRLETIVVDNASSDGAADMVARDFPGVVLIRNASNRGFSRANNQAARQARGRYLFFLNNDTVVPPGSIAALLRYLESHPDVAILGPRLRDGQGRTQVSYRQLPTMAALLHRTALLRWTGLFRESYRVYRRRSFDPTQTRRVPLLMGAAMLIPRAIFAQAGGWDESYTFGGEDIELSARLGRRYKIVYHPAVEITHYGRVSTRLNAAYSMPNVAAGYVRYLRHSGATPAALLFYKLAITLDAPLHCLTKGIQFLWRRLHGRSGSAQKSLLAARGSWFLLCKGLAPLWRA